MADEKNRHTVFAAQAIGLADMFKMMFAKVKLEGSGAASYVLELSTPEGESTGGGKQALQHIRLAPEGGGATLSAGSVNTVDKKAEMRTFSHMATLFADRFKGAEFPIDKGRYEEVLAKLQTFFTNQRYQIVMVELARRSESQVAPSALRAVAASAVARPAGSATRTASSADLDIAVPDASSRKGPIVIVSVAIVVVVTALLLLKR